MVMASLVLVSTTCIAHVPNDGGGDTPPLVGGMWCDFLLGEWWFNVTLPNQTLPNRGLVPNISILCSRNDSLFQEEPVECHCKQ